MPGAMLQEIVKVLKNVMTWSPTEKRVLLAQSKGDVDSLDGSLDKVTAAEAVKPGAFYVAGDMDLLHLVDDSAHDGSAAQHAMEHKLGA